MLRPTTDSLTASQQIIGTQGFGCAYQFDKKIPMQVEQANRAVEMGSRLFKTGIDNINSPILKPILNMPFDTYFFWWRSQGKTWQNGLSEKDKQAEYDATYAFAKKLLLENANQERTFFLGHWEGDWYLLPDRNPDNNPTQKSIDGMIDWLNIRQKAVDDARADAMKENPSIKSKVYHYTEVNRVRDAMINNKPRLVNKVLPHVDVDYVSYSSYDVQRLPQEDVTKTIQYIEGKIGAEIISKDKKNKPSGLRVFIGECAIPAIEYNYDPIKHEKANRKIFIKFLNSGVPYIIYWQMYNNELKNQRREVDNWLTDKEVGYWLINAENEIQPLFTTLQKLYVQQMQFKTREETVKWLENYQPKQKSELQSAKTSSEIEALKIENELLKNENNKLRTENEILKKNQVSSTGFFRETGSSTPDVRFFDNRTTKNGVQCFEFSCSKKENYDLIKTKLEEQNISVIEDITYGNLYRVKITRDADKLMIAKKIADDVNQEKITPEIKNNF